MTAPPDPLRSGLIDLHDSALPLITPPGVDQARRVAHRRQTIRTAVATAAAVLGICTLVALGVMRSSTPPVVTPSPTQTPTSSATASPSPSPTPDPTSPPSSSTGTPTAGPGGPGGSGCASDGVGVFGDANGNAVDIMFSPVSGYYLDPPCPGLRVKVWWAAYAVNPDGSSTLVNQGARYLDHDHLTLRVNVVAPATCGEWYVGHDNVSIPATLPAGYDRMAAAGPGEPFYDAKHGQGGVLFIGDTPCPTSPAPT